jgi:prepilin-type N-terminal cleavage/methylation domain-containing protein
MITNETHTQQERGFALVELMVAIGIIVILSVSLLFQQNKFDSTVQITNVAYEIMTVIKQAQTYSTSNVVGGEEEGVSYGVHFTRGSQEFVLYRNEDVNSPEYDGGDDEVVERFTISGKTEVSEIQRGNSSRDSISISFKRPDPEPIFDSNSSATSARIILENDTETKEIFVSKTGQIQVN